MGVMSHLDRDNHPGSNIHNAPEKINAKINQRQTIVMATRRESNLESVQGVIRVHDINPALKGSPVNSG